MRNFSQYLYTKGTDAALDTDFASAAAYGKVKPGQTAVFWRSGFRWHTIPLSSVQRIFRRILPVHGRLCAGGRSYFIEWLVLILNDGTELELHIGDDVKQDAEALLQALKNTHPQIQYGKVYEPCLEK